MIYMKFVLSQKLLRKHTGLAVSFSANIPEKCFFSLVPLICVYDVSILRVLPLYASWLLFCLLVIVCVTEK